MSLKTLAIFISLVVALSSCSFFKGGISGNNQITETERVVSGFSGIELEGNGNVYLSQGSPSVKIITDSNIQDLVLTKMDGENLVIYSEENISPSKLDIYISMPNCKELEIDGSGSILSQTALSGDELEIEIDGSGSVNLAEIKYVELDIELDGSGNISVAGKVNETEIEQNGSGDINLLDCVSQSSKIELNGSGNISVNVENLFVAELNGSGDILYKGKPKEVRTMQNGSGNIRNLE